MKIVIASILKPADDVRGFEKMAMTLGSAGHEVYLIGMPTTTQVTPPNIHFLELVPFPRLDWKRLLAPLQVLKKIHKVRPEVLIVNTHELLLVSFLNRILFGTRIVYDIQENYYRNILWTQTFSSWIRRPLATWVRLKERVLTPFFNAIVFAEKCYVDEIRFLSKRALVIENKALLPVGFRRRPTEGKIILAFTGTLGKSTGVFEAIRLADKLHEKRADIELHILGSCSIPDVLADIMNHCSGKSYIKLVAGKMPIGHSRIMDLVSKAHFGIISYPPSPHTSNKIPTKLFEYVSARLPILLSNSLRLNSITDAILVDFADPDVDAILREMEGNTVYTGPVDDFLWASEEEKLIALIGRL